MLHIGLHEQERIAKNRCCFLEVYAVLAQIERRLYSIPDN
jgi:hypothetical protein